MLLFSHHKLRYKNTSFLVRKSGYTIFLREKVIFRWITPELLKILYFYTVRLHVLLNKQAEYKPLISEGGYWRGCYGS